MQKTFVLVHGSWHGGWVWRRVADRLEAQGHRVYRPTLTGVGERSHLLKAGINLTTHVTDVVNVFKFEQLSDVVLCGHSYAGFVVSGVAEQVAPAISSIIYLDSFLPNDGESVAEVTPPDVRAAIEDALKHGEIGIPPRAAATFGVNEKDRAWIDAMLRPHPIGAYMEKIALTGARERIAKKTYIRAPAYAVAGFDTALAQAKATPDWRTYEVPCGHDVMVDMPERLTEILLEVA